MTDTDNTAEQLQELPVLFIYRSQFSNAHKNQWSMNAVWIWNFPLFLLNNALLTFTVNQSEKFYQVKCLQLISWNQRVATKLNFASLTNKKNKQPNQDHYLFNIPISLIFLTTCHVLYKCDTQTLSFLVLYNQVYI